MNYAEQFKASVDDACERLGTTEGEIGIHAFTQTWPNTACGHDAQIVCNALTTALTVVVTGIVGHDRVHHVYSAGWYAYTVRDSDLEFKRPEHMDAFANNEYVHLIANVRDAIRDYGAIVEAKP